MKTVSSPYLTQPSSAVVVSDNAYIGGGDSGYIVVINRVPNILYEFDAGGGVYALATDGTSLYAVVGASLTKYSTSLVPAASVSIAGSSWLCVSGTTIAVQGRSGQVEFRRTTDLSVTNEYRAPFVVGYAIADDNTVWLFERNGSGVVKYNLTAETAEFWRHTAMTGVRSGYIDEEDLLHVVCDGGHRLVRYDLDDFTLVSTTAYDRPTFVFYDSYNSEEIIGTLEDNPRGTIVSAGSSRSLYIAAAGGVVSADTEAGLRTYTFMWNGGEDYESSGVVCGAVDSTDWAFIDGSWTRQVQSTSSCFGVTDCPVFDGDWEAIGLSANPSYPKILSDTSSSVFVDPDWPSAALVWTIDVSTGSPCLVEEYEDCEDFATSDDPGTPDAPSVIPEPAAGCTDRYTATWSEGGGEEGEPAWIVEYASTFCGAPVYEEWTKDLVPPWGTLWPPGDTPWLASLTYGYLKEGLRFTSTGDTGYSLYIWHHTDTNKWSMYAYAYSESGLIGTWYIADQADYESASAAWRPTLVGPSADGKYQITFPEVRLVAPYQAGLDLLVSKALP